MKIKKVLIGLIVFAFFILLFMGLVLVITKDSEKKMELETDTQKTELIQEATLPVFDENMQTEEMFGVIYDMYGNNNVRLVGAVVQDTFDDHIMIKTYKAGPGTTSIVQERRINMTPNVPIIETVISEEGVPMTTRQVTEPLREGDFIVIECAEDMSMQDAEELTAVLIMRDVLDTPDDGSMTEEDFVE